jgi:hypothetical protein
MGPRRMPWRSSSWPSSLAWHIELRVKAELNRLPQVNVESLEKVEGYEHHEKPE